MIEKLLKAYKQIDLDIIQSIKEDREDILLLEKREDIINEILNSNISKEEIRKEFLDKGLMELDLDLKNSLEEKKEIIKNNIRKLAVRKEANRLYNSVNRKINFFSTEV